MLEQNNGFLPPEKIKAAIGIALTKEFGNYLEDINQLRNLYVGEDNIEEVQKFMRRINAFLLFLEKNRKADKKPSQDYGKTIDSGYGSFSEPIEELKLEVQAKLNAVAKSRVEKVEKERQERERQQQITEQINNFILDFSVKIASATTNEQLLGYERLINLEKGNKSRYAEQLPLLIERCNELNVKVKEQKDLIKLKETLENEKKKAIDSGDDQRLQDLEERAAEIDSQIEDNTIKVQETATNSFISADNSLSELNMPKARRTSWNAEIVDVKEVVKKASNMLDISLNAEAKRTSINTLKSAGVFAGKEEVIINGIRYFQEKTF